MTTRKIPIAGIDRTVYGEFPAVGIPVVRLRTFGCPFACGWCDVPWTFGRRKPKAVLTPTALMMRLRLMRASAPPDHAPGVVPTLMPTTLILGGGEPLIHMTALSDLVARLIKAGDFDRILIETTGAYHLSTRFPPVEFVVSPKPPSAATKQATGERERGLLKAYAEKEESWFKLVVDGSEPKDTDWAIRMVEMLVSFGVTGERIALMPQARTAKALQAYSDGVLRLAARIGVSYTSRGELLWFGS